VSGARIAEVKLV